MYKYVWLLRQQAQSNIRSRGCCWLSWKVELQLRLLGLRGRRREREEHLYFEWLPVHVALVINPLIVRAQWKVK